MIEAIHSHKSTGSAYKFRERTVLQFGDESTANEMYFELQAAIRKLSADFDEVPTMPQPDVVASFAAPATQPKPSGKLKASDRWADSSALLKELKLEV